ncbi:hypothetical protein, partial [Pseudanabaena sp. 'Roaring Creek']|uniref:hypothetical protein n=1 Tax=Pseudanabaena sp. 'Roaring Creek' TaxID=1681830 RepID=UPI000A7F469D
TKTKPRRVLRREAPQHSSGFYVLTYLGLYTNSQKCDNTFVNWYKAPNSVAALRAATLYKTGGSYI